MNDTTRQWLLGVAGAVVAAGLGGLVGYFTQEGQERGTLVTLKDRVDNLEKANDESWDRLERSRATSRAEIRDEYITLHAQQEQEIGQLRQDIREYERGKR